jgi:hypothetical protein
MCHNVFMANACPAEGKMLAELRKADRQVKSRHYIRHQDMKAWLLSWGTDHELPLPKCVWGAGHDGLPLEHSQPLSS